MSEKPKASDIIQEMADNIRIPGDFQTRADIKRSIEHGIPLICGGVGNSYKEEDRNSQLNIQRALDAAAFVLKTAGY